MYHYENHKAYVFTEAGQVQFLAIRDKAEKLLGLHGAVRLDCLITGVGGGSVWDMLACVDRLVELGELREISQGDVAGQYRVFVSGKR